MGLFDKLERGLERAVKQPFARVFKAEVQPVEIASAMRRAMDDRAAVLGPGRTMVPNVFTIELAADDYDRLNSYAEALTDELVASAEDHADAQRYVAPGPFEVRFVSDDELETGIFRVRPAAKDGRGSRGGPSNAKEYAAAQAAHDARRSGGPGRGTRRDRDEEGGYDPAAYRRDDRERQDGSREDHGPEHEDRGGTRPVRASSSRGGARRGGHSPVSLSIAGRTVPLTGAVTTLGRDESCSLVVDDAGASRRHAEIRISHDGPHLLVLLRDLGSTNGTYLNGEQVGSEELRDGDRITLGRTHITVQLEG